MICEEVCGKKRGKRSRGDTWRWHEEVNEAVLRKQEALRTVLRRIRGGINS